MHPLGFSIVGAYGLRLRFCEVAHCEWIRSSYTAFFANFLQCVSAKLWKSVDVCHSYERRQSEPFLRHSVCLNTSLTSCYHSGDMTSHCRQPRERLYLDAGCGVRRHWGTPVYRSSRALSIMISWSLVASALSVDTKSATICSTIIDANCKAKSGNCWFLTWMFINYFLTQRGSADKM